MVYEVTVSIDNTPTKIRAWGYLLTALSEEDAIEIALHRAKEKANKPYSRYKACKFYVKPGDCVARPDW